MKVLLLSLILVSCSGGRNSTGYSLINDMMHSEALEAFAPSTVFENGQAMQPAPEGTIARGWLPGELDEQGKLIVVKNPHEGPMTAYEWKRGKILFERTCSACHGVKGYGDGLVVTKGGFPAPPAFAGKKRRDGKRWARKNDNGEYETPSGHIYRVITEGWGNMASHAQQLYPEDRWLVAEYVREFIMKGGSHHGKEIKEVIGE